MYRVLIVEDEELEKNAVKSILEKKYGDGIEVRTASDGAEALDICMDYSPEIVIMDIQMPNMSGIEASKAILDNDINARIILLTAYDYFEYAQKAVSIGIKQYLLKPIKNDKLYEAVEKQIGEIEKQKAKLDDILNAKENIEKLRPMVKDFIIDKIVNGDFQKAEIEEYLKILEIHFENAFVFLLEVPPRDHANQCISEAMLKNKIIEILSGSEKFKGCLLSCYGSYRYIAGLVCNKIGDEGAAEFDNRMKIVEYINELYREIYKTLFIKPRIGISDLSYGLESLHDCYRQALYAVNHGRDDISHYLDMADTGSEAKYPYEIEKEILTNVFLEGSEKLLESFERFSNSLIDGNIENISLIKKALLQLNMSVIKNVSEKLMAPYQLYDELILEELVKSSGINDLRYFSRQMLKDINQKVLKSFQSKNIQVVEKTKEYIEKKYAQEITLEDISRELNISPFHLSRLFKRETGYNIFDHLSMVRIDKAKLTLINSEVSVKEICYMVGYSDPNYFCKVFKKLVGLTPTSYRDLNRRKE